MSNTEWSSEDEVAPKKKRKVPTWVWLGCGGGCLLSIVLVALIGFFGYTTVKEGMDPEKQWPHLQEILPFDERPENLRMNFGMNIGMRQFQLMDHDAGHFVTVYELGSARGDYENMMDPEFKGLMGLGSLVGAELISVEVQGREVDCLSFERVKPEPKDAGMGPGMRVDLTTADSKPIVVDIRSMNGEEGITVEDVAEFFEPFDVWRGR